MITNRDQWPNEREGYTDNLRPAYVALPATPGLRRKQSCKTEEFVGSLIAGGGLCWATWVVVHQLAVMSRMGLWPPGPLEVCGMGVLIWMHAKWRRFARLH